MSHSFLSVKYPSSVPYFFKLARDTAISWWDRIQAWSSPAWLWRALSLLAVASMAMGYYAVVTQAVQQGELRHQALVAHNRAIWQCKLLRSASARKSCLVNIPGQHVASG